MKTFKCIKLDILKSKSIFKILPFFLLICLVTTLAMDNAPACWGILYLVFGGLIIVSNPFFAMSNISEVFTNMLPASVANRVFGRYLFGVIVMVVSALLGIAAEFFRMMVRGEISMKGIWVFTAAFLRRCADRDVGRISGAVFCDDQECADFEYCTYGAGVCAVFRSKCADGCRRGGGRSWRNASVDRPEYDGAFAGNPRGGRAVYPPLCGDHLAA